LVERAGEALGDRGRDLRRAAGVELAGEHQGSDLQAGESVLDLEALEGPHGHCPIADLTTPHSLAGVANPPGNRHLSTPAAQPGTGQYAPEGAVHHRPPRAWAISRAPVQVFFFVHLGFAWIERGVDRAYDQRAVSHGRRHPLGRAPADVPDSKDAAACAL